VLLAGDGHEIAWAGICRRGAIGTRRLKRLLGDGERVAMVPDLSREAIFAAVRDARPELLVSWFWTKKIPARFLALAPAVGVHPSLLPRHRGPDPCFWAIDAGDETTGVTAHLLEEEYDTGAMLGQRALRIDPGWDGWRLARALDRPSLALLREVVRGYAQGHPPAPTPQDESLATAAPEPDDADLAIRWAWPAARIERRVRAAAPWPGAWTEIGDRLVTLVRVRPTRDYPRALAPAEAAVRGDGVGVVRAGDDAVELLEGRDEDDAPLGIAELAAVVRAAQ
jgi:methionyl-tRNA formyltransferase